MISFKFWALFEFQVDDVIIFAFIALKKVSDIVNDVIRIYIWYDTTSNWNFFSIQDIDIRFISDVELSSWWSFIRFMNDYFWSTDLESWHFANSDSKLKNLRLQWLPIMNHHDFEDKWRKYKRSISFIFPIKDQSRYKLRYPHELIFTKNNEIRSQ